MGVVLGVDIGGTFTDCIAVDTSGRVEIGKAFSTPPDFHNGFIASIDATARQFGLEGAELLSAATGVYHGCTVGTNALVEGRTAVVGLLTTRGHRDSIFQMKAGRRLHNMPPEYIADVARHEKPPPLVPKAQIREIDERVTADGTILVELNDDQVRAAVEDLREAGVQAFAVSLLWSVRNDAHERRIAKIIRELVPDAFVSTASQVVNRSGEYERTVATVMNSLIGPEMDRYLLVLEERCRELGYDGSVQIMTCSGGLVSTAEARLLPVLTIGSGPVAGLIGSHHAAGSANGSGSVRAPDVITGDMGGTTFDVGVIHDGVPLGRPTSWHGQFEYWVPTLDVRSVGAGGGSIIRFDPAMGTLRVGPESAGAVPGPVCVNRGGTDPTITDAEIVVGILDPDNYLGGQVELDVEPARAALARVGEPIGLNAEEAAAASLRIVDNQMADAIRLVSIDQGFDPRGFTLYAYGGAGPVHGAAVARHVGMTDIVVPLRDFAAAWSAFGIAGASPLVVQEAAQQLHSPFDAATLNEGFEALEADALERMTLQGIDRDMLTVTRHADLRYSLQVNEIEVDAPDGTYDDELVAALVRRFEGDYERLFGEGSGYAEAGFEITGLRVRVRAEGRNVIAGLPVGRVDDITPEPAAHRDVILYETGLTPERIAVYGSDSLSPGAVIAGPGIIQLHDTTIVIPHDGTARVDARGNVHVSLEDNG